MSENFIQSELRTKATASLQKQVEEDLKVDDPDKAVAKELLDEKTKSND